MGTIWSKKLTESAQEIVQQESPEAETNEVRKKEREEDMRKFKAELAAKREARKEAIGGLNRRIEELKKERDREKEDKERLERLLEERGDESGAKGGGEAAEVEGLERQVRALKDVAAIGGEMLRVRELQVNDLKEKLKSIEETGVAYEKEVESMRRLKGLYEERARAMTISHQMEVEREKIRVVAAETRLEIAEEKNREMQETNKELEERITSLDGTVDKNNNEISELKIQLADKREQLYNLTSQMSIINNLFSQILSDPENLDKVSRVLEQHHSLINDLTAKGDINDVASVLMTVADRDHVMSEEEQDIASNLSKVWRLLVELLGHHSKQTQEGTMPESCYKSIDTPSGPKLVISVSQTFLRLKDLILEKNSLVKEVGRLRDLNGHLENRLISQETRLAEVAAELHKTWGVVNKLKSQHKALHTHEQVLRYDLKHKRIMLNELKAQLEDCREMWQMARVKNSQTEKDWIQLRQEFAERKQQVSNSESGYEESPGDSQDEEDIPKLSDDELDSQDNSEQYDRTQDMESEPEEIGDSHLTANRLSESSDIPNDASTSNEESNQETEDTSKNERTLTLDHSSPLSLQNQGIDGFSVILESPVTLLPWDEPAIQTNNSQEVAECCTSAVSEAGITEIDPELEIGNEASLKSEQNPSDDTSSAVSATSSLSTPEAASSSTESRQRTAEEILEGREARLRRLEEQCQHLFNKMSHTSVRSDLISNRLVELHEHYGEARPGSSSDQDPPQP